MHTDMRPTHPICLQQRFAEGLVSHLASGTDMHSSTGHAYDELLAGLPSDPAMAGLLEPLVLPAEAYQIPPGLQTEADQLLQTNSYPQMPEQQQQPMLASSEDDGDQTMPSASFEEHAPSATAPPDVAEQPQYGMEMRVPNATTADFSQVMGQQQQQQQLCWEQPQQLQSSQQAQADLEPSHAANIRKRQQSGMMAMQHQPQTLTHAPLTAPAAQAHNAFPAESAAVITDASKQAASDKQYHVPQAVAPSGNAVLAVVDWCIYMSCRILHAQLLHCISHCM